MHPTSFFRFCPSCGAAREPLKTPPIACGACGFTLYLSNACATAAFLVRPDGKALFIRRAQEPAKDRLAIPGGFIDDGETAEEGLRREFREEVGINPGGLEFLCSHPNVYHYKGVTYSVLDFFFIARATGEETPEALDAVAEFIWLDPREVDPAEMAFPSMVYALERYLAITPPP
ncbi:MAG TPA: NUDIX domain-containing protein [Verrucomicrobiales bacterium]|nr:NUDIX domain-containing protein [Verrucomicrobiales bacterium]